MYEKSLSAKKKIVASMCPVQHNDNLLLLTLLIPNPRAQDKEFAITFPDISELILKLIKIRIAHNEINEAFNQLDAGIRVFKIPYSKFGCKSDANINILVYTGKKTEKKSYLRYHYRFLKTEIEINKLQQLS